MYLQNLDSTTMCVKIGSKLLWKEKNKLSKDTKIVPMKSEHFTYSGYVLACICS